MNMTLEQKIGQKLMVGFDGFEPPQYILDWLQRGQVGGIILFTRNVNNPEQLAKLTQQCHEAATFPILIAIDQEGGMVTRLHDNFTESPGAMALGVANSETLAHDVSEVLAKEMRALGINWVLAPVVDMVQNIGNPDVGTRSLGLDKDLIGRLGTAEVEGFQHGGVATCAKHFPSLGNTAIDTHTALPALKVDLDFLRQNDMIPFKMVIDGGVDTVMVSHVKFLDLDADHPATLSPVIVRKILRDEIGFRGVTSTDCMEMKAVANHYGPGESAVLATLAGNDILFFSHTRAFQEEAYHALVNAVNSGRIPEHMIEESASRIMSLKEKYAITAPPTLEIIRDESNLRVMAEAARKAITVLKHDSNTFPIPASSEIAIGVAEFASYRDSLAMDEDQGTAFATVLQNKAQAQNIEVVSLSPTNPDETHLAQAHQLAMESDIFIIVTRNAHVSPTQLEIAQNLLHSARNSILVCLRNPYDADALSDTDTIICSFGDTAPSLQAVIDVLFGDYASTTKIPAGLLESF